MNSKRITGKMISLMTRQSLKTSRMRNFFVMITIVLASALLTGLLTFVMGREEQNRRELAHRQQVAYYNLSEEQAKALEEDERISCKILVKTGVLTEMENFHLMPCYVSEMSDEIRVGQLESGALPARDDEVAVCGAMLRKMGVEARVGSCVTFSFYDGSRETFTVSGILAGSDEAKQYSVFFSGGYARQGSQMAGQPWEVYAKLKDVSYMSARECKELMYRIGQERGVERKDVGPNKAFLDSLSPDSQMVTLCVLVGAVILLACILVIYGVFYLSVTGRIHQFGQLRTIGMTRKQMRRMVSGEGSVLFLRSAPTGMAVGAAVGYGLTPGGFNAVHMLTILTGVFLLIYLITLLSVRKPAKIAAAVSPMEALRYLPQDNMKQAAGRKLCRGLTPMGLAVINFSKNRKRTAITMLSLGLGGILFMTAATYMSSFNRENFPRQGYFRDAEFHIYYTQAAIELSENGISGLQADAPMGEEMIAAISALEGVKNVREIKCLGVRYDIPRRDEYGSNDRIYPMTEQETRQIAEYLEEGSADYDRLMSGDYVLAAGNNVVQEIYGWKFETGDQIILHYFDGSTAVDKEVTILGIVGDRFLLENNGLEGWFMMPEQAVRKLVEYDSLNTDLLVSTEEAREAAVGEALEQMVAERAQLGLETLAERRVTYSQNADQMFGAISGLAIFIMLFSLLSMMNTLITNIVTRRQELAMLESIGMGRGQTRKMLLGESLLLVLSAVGIAMTVGTFCGYILSDILYSAGAFYMVFRFPTGFSLFYAGALTIVPVLITVVLMRRFARDALVERLRGAENG